MTPLHYAAALENSKECLALLLSHGADGNIKNDVSNDHNMSPASLNSRSHDVCIFLK